jgi:hypothetical protein
MIPPLYVPSALHLSRACGKETIARREKWKRLHKSADVLKEDKAFSATLILPFVRSRGSFAFVYLYFVKGPAPVRPKIKK